MLGEILAGIFLGPTMLGWLAPEVQSWLFPKSQIVQSVAYIGLILFVFTAGLDVDLANIRCRRQTAMLTSISGVALPFALGFGIVILLPWLWGIPSGDLRIFALFMGTALSISALPFIARILIDLNLMKTELGIMIITASTIDDIIGWSLFALILSILNTGLGLALNLGLTIGAFALTIYIIYLEGGNDAIQHSRHIGSLIDIIAISMLAVSFAAEAIGTHGIVCAFLSGVILSERRERRDRILNNVRPIAIGILSPIYFASVGLKADFVTNIDPIIVTLIFIAACAGKIIGASCGAMAGGIAKKEARAIGFGMNARGAMEIALASAALDYGLIDKRILVALVIMALATSMISGSMIQHFMAKPLDEGHLCIKPSFLMQDR